MTETEKGPPAKKHQGEPESSKGKSTVYLSSGSDASPLQEKRAQRQVNEATADANRPYVSYRPIDAALEQFHAARPGSDIYVHAMDFEQFRIHDVEEAERLSYVYLRDRFNMDTRHIIPFMEHISRMAKDDRARAGIDSDSD